MQPLYPNDGPQVMTSDLEAFIPIPNLLSFVCLCVFKVCDWLYPLTADTPVLLANSGIFMFPDPLAGTPGSYVGIVLSSELPAADREMFQDVLLQLTDLRVQVSLNCQYGANVKMGMHVGGVNALEQYVFGRVQKGGCWVGFVESSVSFLTVTHT